MTRTPETPFRFPLGQVIATPAALELLQQIPMQPRELLSRHVRGDWGDMEEEDKQENEFSIDKELRIFSSYVVRDDRKIWVITEADRSVTTILLPEEY